MDVLASYVVFMIQYLYKNCHPHLSHRVRIASSSEAHKEHEHPTYNFGPMIASISPFHIRILKKCTHR